MSKSARPSLPALGPTAGSSMATSFPNEENGSVDYPGQYSGVSQRNYDRAVTIPGTSILRNAIVILQNVILSATLPHTRDPGYAFHLPGWM
jgi:hypothetical protein